MLVLSRKIGQSIRINENVSILVVDMDGRNVKLGIDAPRDIAVHREEVYQRIKLAQRENMVSAKHQVEGAEVPNGTHHSAETRGVNHASSTSHQND